MPPKNETERNQRDVGHLFANMTAVIEDMHGTSVEGQRSDASGEERRAILRSIRVGIASLQTVERSISIALRTSSRDT